MVLLGIPSKVVDKITKLLGLQTAVERTQFDLINTIQPIVDSSPEKLVNTLRKAVRQTTGTSTIYTVPTGNREFYLTFILVDADSNATADNTSISLRITPKGASEESIIFIPKLSLTAQQNSQSLNLSTPILLEPGSVVTIGSDFTVGGASFSGTIGGYEVDV